MGTEPLKSTSVTIDTGVHWQRDRGFRRRQGAVDSFAGRFGHLSSFFFFSFFFTCFCFPNTFYDGHMYSTNYNHAYIKHYILICWCYCYLCQCMERAWKESWIFFYLKHHDANIKKWFFLNTVIEKKDYKWFYSILVINNYTYALICEIKKELYVVEG